MNRPRLKTFNESITKKLQVINEEWAYPTPDDFLDEPEEFKSDYKKDIKNLNKFSRVTGITIVDEFEENGIGFDLVIHTDRGDIRTTIPWINADYYNAITLSAAGIKKGYKLLANLLINLREQYN